MKQTHKQTNKQTVIQITRKGACRLLIKLFISDQIEVSLYADVSDSTCTNTSIRETAVNDCGESHIPKALLIEPASRSLSPNFFMLLASHMHGSLAGTEFSDIHLLRREEGTWYGFARMSLIFI